MSSHINCHCKGCNYKICTTLNSWIAVSTTLFTYEDSKQYFEHHLETIQQLRDGSPQSELEGCVVKLTRCKICRVGLGVRCVETPEDKVHFRYVLYLLMYRCAFVAIFLYGARATNTVRGYQIAYRNPFQPTTDIFICPSIDLFCPLQCQGRPGH